MKHLKILCLTGIAAAALMSQASSASGAVLTSPSGTEYTSSLNLSASGSQLFKAGFAEFTCVFGEFLTGVSVNTSSFATATGFLNLGGCGSTTVDSLASGVHLEILHGGEVRLSGYEVTVSALGTSCIYGTIVSGTRLGTLSGGTPASLKVSASIPKLSGGFLCASPGSWTGAFTVTSPFTLLVD
jgi:hypothetical protein